MALKQKCLRSSGIAEELDANLGFQLVEQFPSEKLPVLGEVIGHILHLIHVHDKYYSYDKAIDTCAQNLHAHWTERNVYPTYLKDVKRRLKREVDEFRKLKRTAANKRTESWKSKVRELVARGKQLFDIFCEDSTRREELEKQYGVPMKQTEWDYLASMRNDRKGRCTSSVDKQWHLEQDVALAKAKKRKERQNMNSNTVTDDDDIDTDDGQFSETSAGDEDEQQQQSYLSEEDEPANSSSNNKRRFVDLQKVTASLSPVKTRRSARDKKKPKHSKLNSMYVFQRS